jgi:hypothetical protein
MKQHHGKHRERQLCLITVNEIEFPVFGGIVQIGLLAEVTGDFLNGMFVECSQSGHTFSRWK